MNQLATYVNFTTDFVFSVFVCSTKYFEFEFSLRTWVHEGYLAQITVYTCSLCVA